MKKIAAILALISGCSLNTYSVRHNRMTYIKDSNNDGMIDVRVTICDNHRKIIREKDTDYDGKMDLMVSAETLKSEGRLVLEELVQIDADYETGIDYEALFRYDRKQILESYEFWAYDGKEKRKATEEEVYRILEPIEKVQE